ncbi:hypothetical protein LINPERHAP2_LOCUS33013 [Linum perenne]
MLEFVSRLICPDRCWESISSRTEYSMWNTNRWTIFVSSVACMVIRKGGARTH